MSKGDTSVGTMAFGETLCQKYCTEDNDEQYDQTAAHVFSRTPVMTPPDIKELCLSCSLHGLDLTRWSVSVEKLLNGV